MAAVLAVAALAAAGCSGDKGDKGDKGDPGTPGAPGAPGTPGPVTLTAETCTVCHSAGRVADPTVVHDAAVAAELARGSITISKVTLVTRTGQTTADNSAGVPEIEFQVRDAAGTPAPSLKAVGGTVDLFNFTVAKYTDPTGPDQQGTWENYFNVLSTSTATTARYRQASREATLSSSSRPAAVGTITNLGGGNYRYRFAIDLTQVNTSTNANNFPATNGNEPFDVPFEPAKVHRIGIQTGVDTVVANGVVDFVPGTKNAEGASQVLGQASNSVIQGALARQIHNAAACNDCHGRLTVHGRRDEVEYCVTCHNPFTFDALGVTADMDAMTHGFHAVRQLSAATAATSVRGATYVLTGVDGAEITYPQDVRHCATCHKNAAEADNWKNRPSQAACTTCHQNVVFDGSTPVAPKVAHTGGNPPALACTVCHTAAAITASHAIPAETEAAAFAYNIVSITNSAAGQSPVITFRVLATADADTTKNRHDIKNSPYWTQTATGASRLAVILGWSNTNFRNVGSGQNAGQVVSINALATGVAQTTANVNEFRIDTATLTPPFVIPAGTTGSGTVALEGHPAVPGSGTRIRAKNASRAFAITGTATARRAVVDIARCNDCHFNLSVHGDNRTGDINTCLMCHNSEATDIGRRTGNTPPFPDGKAEQAVDMKMLIHGIHGVAANGGIVVYGFGAPPTGNPGVPLDFRDVTYPMPLANCQACHIAGTYSMPTGTIGITTGTSASLTDTADNLRTTLGTATCSSCHQGFLSIEHMLQNGGLFGVTQQQIDDLNK